MCLLFHPKNRKKTVPNNEQLLSFRCQGKNAHRYREKFVRLNQSESVFRCHLVNTKRWTSAKFNNIQEQCQVLTILRCRENSAERCQVRLALKFLCCSVFRCASLAYHANLCSLESSFPLFPSSKKASDEVVYLCRDLLLSELAFKDSIIKLTEKNIFSCLYCPRRYKVKVQCFILHNMTIKELFWWVNWSLMDV